MTALVSAGVSGCSSSRNDADIQDQKSYGVSMAKKGFWREALFRFEKAAALKPNDAQLQNNLAVAYEAVGETAKALVAYRKALELSPEDPQIKRNYARFAEYYTGVQRGPSGPGAVK